MTWVSTSKILSCFLFVIFFQGCWSRSQPSNCTVINLDYVDCNWTTAQMWEMNYTFSSVFQRQGSYQECSEYLQEHGHNVGCRIPLEDQSSIYFFVCLFLKTFLIFVAPTLFSNVLIITILICVLICTLDILPYIPVKLNSPYNVSAKWNSKDELCLHWVNLVKKVSCVVNMVRYRRDADPWQVKIFYLYLTAVYFNKRSVYTFQVRSNMKEACGPSELWSDWSDPVHWRNYTENMSFQEWLQVFASVLGAIILIGLAVLLCYYERIRVVLLHVVPDPSKNLQNLFQKYNGNVESWVHVSRELKEAFDPDYTDAPCVVCDPNDTPEPPGRDGPAEQPSS
uniref:Interleukin 2 receptor, gamma b n=1 Tax=Electrophorus electricus TaxID=8005 RepID=A0AAY5ENU8_ELEEL